VDLEFTEDQEHLRTTVRAFLEAECPMRLVRDVIEKGASTDELWAHMVELGWPGLAIAPELGGAGLGFVELAIVCEELGRAVAPGPFLATATQFVPVVREAGTAEQRERFLRPVAAGEITGTLALADSPSAWDPAHPQATATRTANRFELHGTKHVVADGDQADELVVSALLDGHPSLFVVPGDAPDATRLTTLDGSRSHATVRLDGVVVDDSRLLGRADGDGATAHALERALEEASVALALETVGTCQAIFDVDLAYAKVREQFGVPIGSFQAIKHKFADMLVALERARAIAYFAALTIAEDDPRRTSAASMAKAAAGDCQRLLAQEGVQILGGIGYTWEHDMHLYVKRAKSNDALFGNAGWHRLRVAELLGL
jgi:alkylation response protein AidB-like acyl-CoA dehydrogenase